MFIIIGGDGKEYGPATAEQLRAWMTAGRANLDTRAKRSGTEEWRRLGDFDEFAGPGVPPPIPATAAVDPAAGTPVGAQTGRAPTELADRGMRFLSWLLDNVIGTIVVLPGALMIGVTVIMELILQRGEVTPEFTGRAAIGLVLLMVGGLALLITQVWLLTVRGQTLGKLILGIRIVRLRDGANPGFLKAVVIRWVAPGLIQMMLNILPPLGLIFFIVDSCFIFRDDRRCLHDLMADTIVVKAG